MGSKRDLDRAILYNRIHKQELREQLGDKCFLCGFKGYYGDRMTLHEIHFKKHPIRLWYYEKHIEDFVLLCFKCHQSVHWLHDMYSLDWSQVVFLHNWLKSTDKNWKNSVSIPLN